jgi:hypothetical protein
MLALTKVEELKQFLDSHDIPYREGKGEYQVLQIKTPDKGWQVLSKKKGESVASVPAALDGILTLFKSK